MLTKVVEPGLGFLVLFTDPRSDDALASYDASKFQLSIAGYRQCIIFEIWYCLRYGANGCQVDSENGHFEVCEWSPLGFGSTSPKYFLQKLVKMRNRLSTSTWGFWSQKLKFFLFAQKRRKLIDKSFWRLIDDEKSDFDVNMGILD